MNSETLWTAYLTANRARSAAFTEYQLTVHLQAPAARKAEAYQAYVTARTASEAAYRAYEDALLAETPKGRVAA